MEEQKSPPTKSPLENLKRILSEADAQAAKNLSQQAGANPASEPQDQASQIPSHVEPSIEPDIYFTRDKIAAVLGQIENSPKEFLSIEDVEGIFAILFDREAIESLLRR